MSPSNRACFICDTQNCPYLPELCDLRMPASSASKRNSLKKRAANADEYDAYFYDPCQRCDRLPPGGGSDRPFCLRCQHFRLQHLFVCTAQPGPDNDDISLNCGTYEQVMQGIREGCEFCAFLYKASEVQNTAFAYMGRLEDNYRRPGEQKGDRAWVNSTGRSGWRVPGSWPSQFEVIVHAPDEPSRDQDDMSEPIAVAGPYISWDIVKSWLSECISHHQHEVVESTDPTVSLPEGFMVIDVDQGCVSDALAGCSYIALSYVWGELRPGDLTATAANMPFLRTPGALTRKTLPATLWDSLTVCKRLGVRFCWVDRLCIVQDNDSQKIEQIESMDVIFSRAILTICAVGSIDSHTGLWGADDTPRSRGQGHVKIGDAELVQWLPDDRRVRLSHAWWSRAWTYQEYLLSNRKLLISAWQATFECDHDLKFEGLTRHLEKDTHESTARRGGVPPLEAYKGIVEEYNDRTLTWDDDIYGAFQGVFKWIYKTLDQFVWCLPATDFDKALLWRVESLDYWPNDTLGPMMHGLPRIATRPGGHIASWSWVTSKGRTNFIGSTIFSSIARYNSWHETTGLRPVITDGLTWGNEPFERIYAWCIWSSGLIETPLPTDLQDLSFASISSKVQERWPTYKDYWREAFDAPSGPWICEDLTKVALIKEKTGRLLIRTTLRSFRIAEREGSGHMILAGDGTAVGEVDSTTLLPDASITVGKDWDFVALSAESTYNCERFLKHEPSLGQTCDFKPFPDTSE